MAQKPTRMSDIAEKLGISTVTVSKALADKDGVGAKLKQKIKQTALEMNYQKKNEIVKKTDKSYTIGILLTQRLRSPQYSFYWALYLNLIDTLKDYGYYSILEIVSEVEESEKALPSFLSNNRVDGIMILGTMNFKYIQMLKKTKFPLVLLDFYCDDISVTSVITDSFLGCYDMTTHLIKKGHKQIGYVGSLKGNHNSQDRYYGYQKALYNNNIFLREDWILPDRVDGSSDFRNTFILPTEMPTAFVCSNDQCAYHFTRYLLTIGYKIPDEISIVGFYDHIFSLLLEPNLSTYRVDMNHMSISAVEAQKNLIQQHSIASRIIVSGKVVERDSVKQLV